MSRSLITRRASQFTWRAIVAAAFLLAGASSQLAAQTPTEQAVRQVEDRRVKAMIDDELRRPGRHPR